MNLVLINYHGARFGGGEGGGGFATFESYFLKSSIQSNKKLSFFVTSHEKLPSSECGLLVVRPNRHKIGN